MVVIMDSTFTSAEDHRSIGGFLFETEIEDITVVVPVLNEQDAIGDVIKNIKDEGYINILIVDGYSTDNTVNIASRNGVQVIAQNGLGKSGAIKTAIEHVKTPYFIVLDGDCTYSPIDIKNMIPHMPENEQIIGVRTNGKKNIPLLNRFGNFVINTTFNMLFGTKLLDVCSGMYALQTEFAKTLTFETAGFDVEVEIAAQTAKYGNLTQVPINYYERVGVQKLRPFRHGVQIMVSILRLALRYNPVFIYASIASLSLVPAIALLVWVFLQSNQGLWQGDIMLLGIILFIIGVSALTLSTISVLLKRMEQRILRNIRLQFKTRR